jgi:hypothetical protein
MYKPGTNVTKLSTNCWTSDSIHLSTGVEKTRPIIFEKESLLDIKIFGKNKKAFFSLSISLKKQTTFPNRCFPRATPSSGLCSDVFSRLWRRCRFSARTRSKRRSRWCLKPSFKNVFHCNKNTLTAAACSSQTRGFIIEARKDVKTCQG